MHEYAADPEKPAGREPAGYVFSGLIAHDRKHRLDRYRPVTLEEHRPRRLNTREVEEAEI
jgi:hypothetical protein